MLYLNADGSVKQHMRLESYVSGFERETGEFGLSLAAIPTLPDDTTGLTRLAVGGKVSPIEQTVWIVTLKVRLSRESRGRQASMAAERPAGLEEELPQSHEWMAPSLCCLSVWLQCMPALKQFLDGSFMGRPMAA